MQNKSLVASITAVLIVVGIAAVAVAKQNSNRRLAAKEAEKHAVMEKEAMETNEGSAMDQEKDKAMTEGEKMMDKNDSSAKEGASEKNAAMTDSSTSTYLDYSPQVLADAETAQKSGRKVVLFFYAPWCPYCRAADSDFKTRLGTDAFPKNTTLIKTDYDSQTELKKKYGVTHQHTFVQIDASGNQITKWVSGDSAELQTNIK